MPDVIVLLPGITGSVLQKDGKDLWTVSGGAIWRALRSLGGNLADLRIDGVDDHRLDDLGDGITAPKLMPDIHLIPGLWRIDGYGVVSKSLKANFDLTEGENYFEFPYDWRRDNRVHARRLRKQSHDWLTAWRQSSGNQDAKLILIGHSMGGLVARAFLELEQGWSDTRYLITFGTPFAGSLNALDNVANGFKKGVGPLSLDLSDALRSMTSVYQLLPAYPCIESGGERLRASEATGVPHLDHQRAVDAHAFHKSMNESAEARQAADGGGYEAYPIVGYSQPTWQSATLTGGDIELSRTIGGKDPGGDGTVPRPSAVPQEIQSMRKRAMFSAAVHGSLQNAEAVLAHLNGLLTPDFDPEDFKALEQTISLDCDDVFGTDEDIVVRGLTSEPDTELEVTVVNTETGETVRDETIDSDGGFGGDVDDDEDEWQSVSLRPLPEGSYRVTVSATDANAQPVSDLFVVFEEA